MIAGHGSCQPPRLPVSASPLTTAYAGAPWSMSALTVSSDCGLVVSAWMSSWLASSWCSGQDRSPPNTDRMSETSCFAFPRRTAIAVSLNAARWPRPAMAADNA